AGVDRALERVAALDAHHVADPGHAEQRGDARREILAERGGRREYMAVAVGGLRNLRRQHGGQRMCVLGAGDGEYATHAGDLRRLGGDRVDAVGEYQHVNRFALHRDGGAHGARGGGVEFAAEVFGDDQDLAHVDFLVPSFPCRREPSVLDRWRKSLDSRWRGSDDGLQQTLLLQGRDQFGRILHHHALAALGWRRVVRGLQVVVRLDAERTELDHVDRFGFRLHDVRSLMKRGSLRRRSVVITAGSSAWMTSRPASTSRVTVALPSAISTLPAKVACG